MQPLEKIPAGKPISAGWISRLVDMVNAVAARTEGGSGGGGAGVALAMAAMGGGIGGSRDRFVLVKLKDVRLDTSVGPAGQRAPVASGSGAMAYWPSQVRYHILGIGVEGIDVDNVVPYYGRPVVGDEARIVPAKKDSTAMLERDIDADGDVVPRLMLMDGYPGGEVVARKRCGG